MSSNHPIDTTKDIVRNTLKSNSKCEDKNPNLLHNNKKYKIGGVSKPLPNQKKETTQKHKTTNYKIGEVRDLFGKVVKHKKKTM